MLWGLAGCGFHAAGNGPIGDDVVPKDDAAVATDDGAVTAEDAAIDAATIDAPPGTVCYGSFGMVCLASAPTGQMVIETDLLVDTGASPLCATTVTGTTIDACVIATGSITVNADIVAFGARPLVLLAPGQIVVNGGGKIDVSSHASVRGAGALTSCVGGILPTGGGGGAGGSFFLLGGTGGNGGAGSGGVANPAALLLSLRGGCPGMHGGKNVGGAGGLGGGAVQLISNAITINNLVAANGAGGLGAEVGDAGGGGGGSGGAIVFDTMNLTINGAGRVTAQGGSGAEGSSMGADGTDGKDPATGVAAPGGDGSSSGGGGGNGGVSVTTQAEGGHNGGAGAGGGGAGGGAGFVRTTDPQVTNTGLTFPNFN